MNTRLKIVCVLFGLVYFYFIGTTVIQEIPEFIQGFNDGRNEARGFDTKADGAEKTSSLLFRVKPVSGAYSFPGTVLNLKTGNSMRAEFSNFNVKVDRTQAPLWIRAIRIFFGLIAFIPLVFAILFIPIQIYKVIRSIVKNEIFESRNINRFRWIGYCLLIIFVAEVFFNVITTAEARALIHLEDYRIVFRMTEEYYWLLFGLVTLMFAEILKISHSMKVEQDLTI